MVSAVTLSRLIRGDDQKDQDHDAPRSGVRWMYLSCLHNFSGLKQ